MKILLEKGDTKKQIKLAEALLENGIVNSIIAAEGELGHAMKSDEEIARAIKSVMVYFSVKAQWVAIYRVLVDYYGFPAELTSFCKRIKLIMKGDSCKYPCDYQSIQKPLASCAILQKHYSKWQEYKIKKGDRVFPRQKKIADKLLELLE